MPTNAGQLTPKVGDSSQNHQNKIITIAICLAIAALVSIAFGRCLAAGFVNYDDDQYVYANPEVVRGLTFSGVVWAFTHFQVANWHPLTMLSHMADCQFYGLHPWGHHLSNIILHITTAVLLFIALQKLTAELWPSAFVAALFAVHPLRVESVAWISERKDVLSGVFFMLGLMAYQSYARHRSIPRYLGLIIAFALGLMCKPSIVTLPFVLLLLDYWPLGRAGSVAQQKQTGIGRTWWPLIREKIPLFVLSAVSCAITLKAQRRAFAEESLLPLGQRVGNAAISYIEYIGQTIWPARLAVLYPYPKDSYSVAAIAMSLLLVVGITALFYLLRVRRPYLLVGWLWFIGMMIPMAGLVQVGLQARADRYTYLPFIGLGILVSWGATSLVRQWNMSRKFVSLAAVVVIGALAARSYSQTGYWKSGETLWRGAIQNTSENHIAHNNLANWFLQQGRLDEAVVESQKALAINPGLAEGHVTLGNTLVARGDKEGAVREYRLALQLQSDFGEVRSNLASLLLENGDVNEAIANYEAAVHDNPEVAGIHSNLAKLFLGTGKIDEAIVHYRRALAIDPNSAEVTNDLGNALLQRGQVSEAIDTFEKALSINPDLAEAHYNLANIYLQRNENESAVTHYQKAIELKPDYADADYNLAKAFAALGNLKEAVNASQAAIHTRPAFAEAHNNLGCFLLRLDRTEEARNEFQSALAINANFVDAQYNLGHLLVEMGRPEEAILHFEVIARIQPGYGDTEEMIRQLHAGKSTPIPR